MSQLLTAKDVIAYTGMPKWLFHNWVNNRPLNMQPAIKLHKKQFIWSEYEMELMNLTWFLYDKEFKSENAYERAKELIKQGTTRKSLENAGILVL